MALQRIGNADFAASGTESSTLDLRSAYGGGASSPSRPKRGRVPWDEIVITTAEDAFTGTITVEFSLGDGTTFVTAQGPDGAGGFANIALAAASSIVVTVRGPVLRLNSSGTEADAVTIEVYGIEYV